MMEHENEKRVKTKPGLKSILAQVIACMGPNFLLFDMGLSLGFSIIAIPALLSATEGLSLTESQSSWFSSIGLLMQPIGGLASGPLTDYLGRKKSLLIANIPHAAGWILFYFSWSVPSLFLASVLMGIGSGIMQAPVYSYVGEISEPSIRGRLCSAVPLFTSFGSLVMYYLGTIVHWRTAAILSLVAPINSVLCILLVPESPIWLLGKGREKEAIKSLRFLRGWTTTAAVRDEFDRLVEYLKAQKPCLICEDDQQKECVHADLHPIKRGMLIFRSMLFLGPLIFVKLYFMFFFMSGSTTLRSNMVNLCDALGIPGDSNNAVFMTGIITFGTSIFVVFIIKIIGKRKLALTAMLGCAVCMTGLAVYSFRNLNRVNSYDPSTFPEETSRVPQVLLFLLIAFNACCIPWVMVSEVFSYKCRSYAQGVAVADIYFTMYFISKTYINFEDRFGLGGTFLIYAVCGYLGVLYLYFRFPETEGKSLEEIEQMLKEKKSFADDPFINLIRKSKKENNHS